MKTFLKTTVSSLKRRVNFQAKFELIFSKKRASNCRDTFTSSYSPKPFKDNHCQDSSVISSANKHGDQRNNS